MHTYSLILLLCTTLSQTNQPPDDLASQLDQVLSQPQSKASQKPAPAPAAGSLMNPDISVIVDATAGIANGPPPYPSGDDPNIGLGSKPGGFTVQELEIGFQSVVDPYLTANAFLTIPNLEGIEVEEAYATTTALPWGLQLKGGIFRSAISRQNEQHLHMQSFIRRPLLNAAYLGEDGLRAPGVQLSWLAPSALYLWFGAEALSVEPDSSITFGGANRRSPAVTGTARVFFNFTESLSLLLSPSIAAGHAPTPYSSDDESSSMNGAQTLLAGTSLYLKWSRPNNAWGYLSLALQSEYFWRRIASTAKETGGAGATHDGGFYAQLVSQLSRRWYAGVRYDLLGLPSSTIQPRVSRVSAMTAFTPSEFSRIRLQVDRDHLSDEDTDRWEALLLLEYAVGAHGAHPF